MVQSAMLAGAPISGRIAAGGLGLAGGGCSSSVGRSSGPHTSTSACADCPVSTIVAVLVTVAHASTFPSSSRSYSNSVVPPFSAQVTSPRSPTLSSVTDTVLFVSSSTSNTTSVLASTELVPQSATTVLLPS